MVNIDDLMKLVRSVCDRIKESRSILVVFSDDGDGLASALLLKLLADRMNIDSSLICLDKVFPEVLNELMVSRMYDLIIFLDLGGPFHRFIGDKYLDKFIIIDHHEEHVAPRDRLLYVNPTIYGFNMDNTPLTSTIAYYIFKYIDEGEALKWAWIGVLGLGENPNPPSTLNWRMLQDGIRSGHIVKHGKTFRIIYNDIRKSYHGLYKDITIISSGGYFKDAYIDLFKYLLDGDSYHIRREAEKYSELRRKAFERLLSILEEEGLNIGNNIQWFIDYNHDFYNLGTRVFDSFVSYISYQARLYDKRKYIIGLCERNPYIPGYGYLSIDWYNIAVRVSRSLGFLIDIGRMQPVSALVEAAAYRAEGIGYGHRDRGAAVVPYHMGEAFLSFFDELAGELE